MDWILYSGNAGGSDIAFQEGSGGKCVIMLPWDGFNIDEYDYEFSRDHFVLGYSNDGRRSVDKYHPNPSALSNGAKMLMSRNYHQIFGYRSYPRSSLVICCATERNGKVQGGTGQAVRMAEDYNIPIINIRNNGWKRKFMEIIDVKI